MTLKEKIELLAQLMEEGGFTRDFSMSDEGQEILDLLESIAQDIRGGQDPSQSMRIQ